MLELPDLGPFVLAGEELLLVGCVAGDDLLAFSSARSKLVAISLLFCSMLGSRAMSLGLMTLG